MTTNNSNTTSTVNLNITKDKSYTEKSNNYYEDIDNEILQTECEDTIVFEDCEDAEEPTTKNVTFTNRTRSKMGSRSPCPYIDS